LSRYVYRIECDEATSIRGDLVVRLAPKVLVHDGGRVIVGGSPLRLMRLSERGAGEVARWRRGAAIGASEDSRQLAARMLEAGILLPDPQADPLRLAGSVTFAVPVKDRAEELARCLAALVADAPDVPILVVDDASTNAEAIAAVASRHGAALMRLDQPHGPAGARNVALDAVATPLIAFVDSDVVVDPGWLARLVVKFDDPGVDAAAPRVQALTEHGGLLTEYEARHSSLDMGPCAGWVGIGRAVPYVPSAALVVRRAAVSERFDPGLPIGEDVDFVWRIAARGGRVLYDPGATVRHDHRVALGAFVRRRLIYARSIGVLTARHPRALPAMHVEPWSASALLLLATGRVDCGLAATATLVTRTVRIRAALEGSTPLAARLSSRAMAGSARGLGHALRRAWSPLLLPLAWRSRRVRLLLAAAVLGAAADERVRPRHVPLKALDDLLAAAGTWAGCLDQRTLRPLLPQRLGRQMASPPSTGTAAPVIPLASGPASHAMADAISSGERRRSSGCCVENASADSSA
jgi:mycofactocin system glycosyltransferase